MLMHRWLQALQHIRNAIVSEGPDLDAFERLEVRASPGKFARSPLRPTSAILYDQECSGIQDRAFGEKRRPTTTGD